MIFHVVCAQPDIGIRLLQGIKGNTYQPLPFAKSILELAQA